MSKYDNYPPGAANDPRAPYNEPDDDEFTRTVSVTISFDYTITLPSNADEEWIEENIENEVREVVRRISRETRVDDFGIDELEILEE